MKNYFLRQVSICSAVHIDHLPLYAKPIPLTDLRSSRAAVAQTCAGFQPGPCCSSDCKTFMVCIGADTPNYQMPCASMSSSTPYCVGNTCTSTPNVTNSNCQASFVCTSEGTFPGKYKNLSFCFLERAIRPCIMYIFSKMKTNANMLQMCPTFRPEAYLGL